MLDEEAVEPLGVDRAPGHEQVAEELGLRTGVAHSVHDVAVDDRHREQRVGGLDLQDPRLAQRPEEAQRALQTELGARAEEDRRAEHQALARGRRLEEAQEALGVVRVRGALGLAGRLSVEGADEVVHEAVEHEERLRAARRSLRGRVLARLRRRSLGRLHGNGSRHAVAEAQEDGRLGRALGRLVRVVERDGPERSRGTSARRAEPPGAPGGDALRPRGRVPLRRGLALERLVHAERPGMGLLQGGEVGAPSILTVVEVVPAVPVPVAPHAREPRVRPSPLPTHVAPRSFDSTGSGIDGDARGP